MCNKMVDYIVHHSLNLLLHYLAISKLLILLFWSTINANTVLFGHKNEAVFSQLIFVDPGIKINGEYHRDMLLKQEMLSDIRAISGDFFIFQLDSAPPHRARKSVALLQREFPAVIAPNLWPPNSPDLNPVDYKVLGGMQDRIYLAKMRDVDDLKQRLIDVWDSLHCSNALQISDVWSNATTLGFRS